MAKTATFGVMHVITAFSVTYALTGNYRGEINGDAQVEWVRVGTRYQVHLSTAIGPVLSGLSHTTQPATSRPAPPAPGGALPPAGWPASRCHAPGAGCRGAAPTGMPDDDPCRTRSL